MGFREDQLNTVECHDSNVIHQDDTPAFDELPR